MMYMLPVASFWQQKPGGFQIYNPPRYQSNDVSEAFELMEYYPFATVISVVDQEPVISHLPLTPVMTGQKMQLIGHLAKANSHWQELNKVPVTALFHGAHAYITPKWYEQNDVPTWNYSTVHVTGRVELIEHEAGLIECLKGLREHMEKIWPSGWEFFVPEDLAARLTQSIAGFRIHVESIQFKQKLGQNKSPKSIEGVVQGLEARGGGMSLDLIRDMKKYFSKRNILDP